MKTQIGRAPDFTDAKDIFAMREVTPLFTAMELLRRRVNKDMPIQHVSLLLAVAESPGITMPELMESLKMPQGTVSRNIKVLCGYVACKDGVTVLKGYNLLRTEPDPANRRMLAVYLTPRGEALVRELTGRLNPRSHQEESRAALTRQKFEYPALDVVKAVAQ